MSIYHTDAFLFLTSLQNDPHDEQIKAIRELKDGNTGLPFNMEYSGISAGLDFLKDPNAIDDRKMLVSSPSNSYPYFPTNTLSTSSKPYSPNSPNFPREVWRRGWSRSRSRCVSPSIPVHDLSRALTSFFPPSICTSVFIHLVPINSNPHVNRMTCPIHRSATWAMNTPGALPTVPVTTL